MAYIKSKYDGECYYNGKLVGRCTVADSDGYSVLMEACGGNAARVLREYAYFSPELKAIFEKVAALQEMQRPAQQTANVLSQPKNSPWGKVHEEYTETLLPGVFMVYTAGHGGIMVSNDMTAILSPAARKCGMKYSGFLCYEEDTEENIVFRELLDKKLWSVPDRIKDKAGFEERLNEVLREYHPDYWRTRQTGREKTMPRQDIPIHAHSAEL